MPLIHLDCPSELVSVIDNIVSERKKIPKYRPLTAEQKKKALDIARVSGVAVSNAYLRALQHAQMQPRHSRTSVTLELLIDAVANYKPPIEDTPEPRHSYKAAIPTAPAPPLKSRKHY